MSIAVAGVGASLDTGVGCVVTECSLQAEVSRTSVYAQSGLVVGKQPSSGKGNVGSRVGKVAVKDWTPISAKLSFGVSEIVHTFGAEGHTHVGRIVTELVTLAVSPDCLAVRTN